VTELVYARICEASAPYRRWFAAFTYIWPMEGWLYVAAVIDRFSRRILGWSMSAAMTTQLVSDALVMVIWRRGRLQVLLHHSDRGSRYASANLD
jgi:putative transposase